MVTACMSQDASLFRSRSTGWDKLQSLGTYNIKTVVPYHRVSSSL